jgi:hypothetical protein
MKAQVGKILSYEFGFLDSYLNKIQQNLQDAWGYQDHMLSISNS